MDKFAKLEKRLRVYAGTIEYDLQDPILDQLRIPNIKYDLVEEERNPKQQFIFAESEDIYIIQALSRNINLIPEIQRIFAKRIIDKRAKSGEHELIKNPGLLPELQHTFADCGRYIRAELAKNPGLIEEVQLKLVKDPESDTIVNLQENPNLTERVRKLIIKRRSTPPWKFHTLE